MVGSVSLSLFLYLSLYRSLLPCTSHYYHYFFFYISVFTASSPDLLSLALSALSMSSQTRGECDLLLPPFPPPLPTTATSFEFYSHDFHFLLFSIPDSNTHSTLLLFYFYSRRVCKPSSVLSVLVFPRHEGVEGGGEGVEIGRQPSPRPRTLRDIFEGDLPARPPTESNP